MHQALVARRIYPILIADLAKLTEKYQRHERGRRSAAVQAAACLLVAHGMIGPRDRSAE